MESSSSGLLVHFRFSARRLQPVSLQVPGWPKEKSREVPARQENEDWKGERALSSANLLTLLVIEFPAG